MYFINKMQAAARNWEAYNCDRAKKKEKTGRCIKLYPLVLEGSEIGES
jgi:hypothetical protein